MTEQQLPPTRLRHDYDESEVQAIYESPLPDLIYAAQSIHKQYFANDEVEFCELLSIKTGGCREDCAYCPQSAHYKTDVEAHGLLDLKEVGRAAAEAKAGGATRFCMGAAWRSPPERGDQFGKVLEAVRTVSALGLEVCVTLGMLNDAQARALRDAGVYAYNHNLDTSPEYYDKIITTRTFEDRLKTLAAVRRAGMTVCCGGIVGLGEERLDRIKLLCVLSGLDPHPESVPVNLLMKADGTPLQNVADLDVFELVRTIATARILMPKSRVRLSAGRTSMSDEAQALCFLAGANSVFVGEKLLTAANPDRNRDYDLLERLGMRVKRGVAAPTKAWSAMEEDGRQGMASV